MSMETLTIERLGQSGDGIARGPFGPVYVSFTLPGETAALAVNRDRGCAGGGVVSNCSGIAQADWAFTKISAGF